MESTLCDDGLMQEKHNTIGNALELCLSSNNILQQTVFAAAFCMIWKYTRKIIST